jgi:hypothetical protein
LVFLLPTVRLVFQVAIHYFNPSILSLMSPFGMILVSQIVSVIRLAVYGFVPATILHVWTTLPLEAMRGVSVALLSTGSIRMAYDLAPPTSIYSAQGLHHVVFHCAAGFVADKLLSGDFAFFAKAAFFVFGGLFSVLYYYRPNYLSTHEQFHAVCNSATN